MGVKERIFLFLENQSISKAEFERRAKLSNGYLNNFKGAFGAEKLEYILTAFPNLNKVWLLTGEGEMLNPSVIQNNQNGHNINGHSVKVEQKTDIEKMHDTIKECHELLRKKDEQIDRLLTLLERK